MKPIDSSPHWSQAALVSFRFLFLYFILYIFPFPFGIMPGINLLFQPVSDLQWTVNKYFADSVLHLSYQPLDGANGSGDTTLHYISFFACLSLSVIGMMVWSVIDRRRVEYKTMLYWLLVLIRFYLAFILIRYGLIKIFYLQFSFPSTYRLLQTYGESSPMGLLWTFMGYSYAYNVFTGLGEIIGGSLLLFRRTKLLGALITIAVMSNVVILNFTFDVPVKLFSTHLLIMSIFITAPYLKRLCNFFIFNSAIEPIAPVQHFKWKRMYLAGKVLFIGLIIITDAISVSEQMHHVSKVQSDDIPSLQGEYEVKTFILNGQTISPDTLQTQRWKKIVLNPKTTMIHYMDSASSAWYLNANVDHSRIIIHSRDLRTTGSFRTEMKDTVLTLEGMLDQNNLKVICYKKAEGSFLLVNRGFHWVNEYPYNR
jgi:uncharacterized membrane protein YphA (DoxX/SURF4 family)